MEIQIRAWFGPWTTVTPEQARDFTRHFGGLSRDTIEECQAHMKNHLRGVTVSELFADYEDELPVWLQGRIT